MHNFAHTRGTVIVISDEAVEAAFRSMYGPGPSNPANGGDAHLLKELRKALEAAAPKLTGAAWEDGYGHGYKHGYSDCLKQNGYESRG